MLTVCAEIGYYSTGVVLATTFLIAQFILTKLWVYTTHNDAYHLSLRFYSSQFIWFIRSVNFNDLLLLVNSYPIVVMQPGGPLCHKLEANLYLLFGVMRHCDCIHDRKMHSADGLERLISSRCYGMSRRTWPKCGEVALWYIDTTVSWPLTVTQRDPNLW